MKKFVDSNVRSEAKWTNQEKHLSREKDKQKHQTCANGAQKRKPDC